MSDQAVMQQREIDSDLLGFVEETERNSQEAYNTFVNAKSAPVATNAAAAPYAVQKQSPQGVRPSYQYSNCAAAPASTKNGTVGMVLSAIAFFMGLIVFISVPLAITGLVLSIKSKDSSGKITVQGILGIVFAIVALLIALVFVCVAFVA